MLPRVALGVEYKFLKVLVSSGGVPAVARREPRVNPKGVESSSGHGATWLGRHMPGECRAPASVKAGSMRDQKVALVVEDDPYVRVTLVDALETAGYAVLEASNGGSGLRLAERDAPDVMLVDLELPELGGLDLLRELQQNKASWSPPDIVVSASVKPTAQTDRAEVAGWLQKPSSLDDLLALVRQATGDDRRQAAR